jgi:hypothetical protein
LLIRSPSPSTDEQPEELVEQIQLWAWMEPLEHDELLTKRQILKKKTGMRAKEAKERSKAESNKTRRNIKGRPFWSRVWVHATTPTERSALHD